MKIFLRYLIIAFVIVDVLYAQKSNSNETPTVWSFNQAKKILEVQSREDNFDIIFEKITLQDGYRLKEKRYHPTGGVVTARTLYTYDSNNRRIEELNQTYYYQLYWENKSKVLNQYNSINNLIESKYYVWNANSWRLSLKTIFSYDGNNNLTERYTQEWDGSYWFNVGQKYIAFYDGNNNLIEYTYQEWVNPNWINLHRDLFRYDSLNREIESLQQNWNGSWGNVVILEAYIYDANNNLLEQRWKYWGGTSWLGNGRNLYLYDLNNNRIQHISTDSFGDYAYKYTNTYDWNNNMTESLYQPWENGNWINYSRDVFTFVGVDLLSEMKSQDWNGTNWINRFKYTYLYETYVTAIDEKLNVPEAYSLSNNYPNPFNPTTKITYSIPVRSNVSLKVFDLLGSEVVELVKGEIDAGIYNINFNAANLPSGVYFYRLQAGSFVQTRKMILLK